MGLSKEILEILACPKCKGDIEEVEDGKYLLCRVCKLKYPVRDGIPVMLIEEAEEAED